MLRNGYLMMSDKRIERQPLTESSELETEKLTEEAVAHSYLERRDLIRVPFRGNEKLKRVIERVNAHAELRALWQVQNINAVDRLGMSDHGAIHMQIIANIALKIFRLLLERDVKASLVKNFAGFANEDSEIVVVLASLLHDLGMSIHRIDHESYSLFIAQPIIDDLLGDIYEVTQRTIMRSEILHSIISHRAGGHPLTVEAGVVRVADALDMAKGRSRIAFEAGKVNIHSVSAAAIEKVEIGAGEEKAVRVRITMNNSAGIFQVDELTKDKLRGSGIEKYVEVEAAVEGESDKRLIKSINL